MAYKIYYRKSLMEADELAAASKHFETVSLLSDIHEGDFVIYRYSLYPFPLDQQKEIANIGAHTINTYNQHRYAADLQNYVYDLKELTPKTWERLQDIPEVGPFILKGETNSRKSNWKRDMFAPTKKDAIEIHGRLTDDSLIGQQKIFIREYVPLLTYLEGIGGIPITEEYRFFAAYGEILAGGFYWQNHIDDIDAVPDHNNVPKEFLAKVLERIGNQINFVVIDVARTATGEWIVIELNDGSQSGTSCIDLDVLYSRLKEVLVKRGLSC